MSKARHNQSLQQTLYLAAGSAAAEPSSASSAAEHRRYAEIVEASKIGKKLE